MIIIKHKFQYFRFWFATKIVMLALRIIDKTTFEGISLAMVLDTWTKQLMEQVTFEQTRNTAEDDEDYIVKEYIKEKEKEIKDKKEQVKVI